ncbi:MAG: hypothetical protein J6P53_00235 [Mailhella sp.]|nr:hypothetical protein [Mailhella sp.]
MSRTASFAALADAVLALASGFQPSALASPHDPMPLPAACAGEPGSSVSPPPG